LLRKLRRASLSFKGTNDLQYSFFGSLGDAEFHDRFGRNLNGRSGGRIAAGASLAIHLHELADSTILSIMVATSFLATFDVSANEAKICAFVIFAIDDLN